MESNIWQGDRVIWVGLEHKWTLYVYEERMECYCFYSSLNVDDILLIKNNASLLSSVKSMLEK